MFTSLISTSVKRKYTAEKRQKVYRPWMIDEDF
jgi:hypothetical protein